MGRLLILILWISLLACRNESVVINEPASGIQADTSHILDVIAFGSCSKTYVNQPLWTPVLQNKPDIWIWLGDIIYADSENPLVLETKYNKQKSRRFYKSLLDSVYVTGIWDDHDYGCNDGDKTFSIKDESQKLLLDFLDVPDSAAVRSQKGIYRAESFGTDSQLVKIILLDGRYFRDQLQPTLIPGGPRYFANQTGDILGDAQWEWLEKELTASPAQIHIIASGIQVISKDHAYEKWANFPQSRQRLFDLLNKTKPNRPVIISGDRHLAEISRIDLDSLNHPLYDITSSGMTHSYEVVEYKGEINEYRVDDLLSGRQNFGLLKIDWSHPEPRLNVEIRGKENKLLFKHTLK